MIYILVGHRGTGKTLFLKELEKTFQKYQIEATLSDLDEEIEKDVQKSIREIFLDEGEEAFRKYEEKALFKFFSRNVEGDKLVIVALGAGYREILPESASIIWLQRSTDHLGRIFLDRPRLDAQLPPLVEYFNRYGKRSVRYQGLADETLFVPENYKSVEPWLPLFWGITQGDIGGCLTLLPWFLEDKNKTKKFLLKRLNWGVHFFELRTDLLSLEQMHWIRELVPESQLLLSVRGKADIPMFFPEIDWALELGEPPESATIVSLHERDKDFSQTLRKIEQFKTKHLKLAVEVETWEELQQGFKWFNEDRENRSFLPRSKTGRWNWFRLLNKYQMKLNFFREDIGSSLDQPYFVDWCNYKEFSKNKFGALLGSPVTHSWTPEEQRKFWASKECNSLAIEIKKEEWSQGVLDFLRELGLAYAAVTSPLKSEAFHLCKEKDLLAAEFKMANTIKFTDEGCESFNTDFHGLKVMCEQKVQPLLNKPLSEWKVAIWGGGGTLPVIQKLFPQSKHFSARTGKAPSGKKLLNRFKMSKKEDFDILIWAVGRHHMEEGAQFPPQDMKFQYVVDLNYADNSPGKELALIRGLQYISGEAMFFAQAEMQRQLWALKD